MLRAADYGGPVPSAPGSPVLSEAVAAALAVGAPVVALESTILSHGLPHPRNRQVADAIEQAVRDGGATPATIAVMAGVPRIGLDPRDLDRLCRPSSGTDDVAKASTRDLAWHVVRGSTAATTVAATAHLAAKVGIRVFATGGIGGVHRGARDSWDESADLAGLARTPITVVCSGAKSILDIGATLERLESLGVTVAAFGSDSFPGFYVRDSGHRAPQRVDSEVEAAELECAQRALGLAAAIVLGNPIPAEAELDPVLHREVVDDALATAERVGVAGADLTPYVLDRLHRRSKGATLEANIALVLANAARAARIAVAISAAEDPSS